MYALIALLIGWTSTSTQEYWRKKEREESFNGWAWTTQGLWSTSSSRNNSTDKNGSWGY